jgi:FKBP-type peptidyl-prolyl cis-trans isomerase FklB
MVRAMKRARVVAILKTCSASFMFASAPLVGAQPPAPAQPTAPAPASPAAPPAPAAPAESPDQTSYLFGLTFGEQMHRGGITDQVSMEAIERGIKDGLQGKRTTPADQQLLNSFVNSVLETTAARNAAAARDFLAHNAHEKGVITTASGLQYKILVPGDRKAAPIGPNDEVTVQYRGKLLDGSEFDSSYARGKPETFRVHGVIKGWQEALVLMKPGAKWQLFLPPDLGYGARLMSGIPSSSLLIFDVELLSAKSTAAIAAPPAHPNSTTSK